MYNNSSRTVDDYTSWVAQYSNGVPVAGRWMFDSFLTIDLTAPSGTGTDLGATNAADWTALLDRWFGTTAGGGTIGAIDAAITKVAATKSTSGALMGQPPTRRKIVVTIPWAADSQANFGVVDGKAADLRVASERDRVTAWYLDQVKQRFAAGGYRNVDLWGVYLMREDIIPSDETWATHTAAAAHQRGLKIAWIPYYKAPGWQNWRSFGIDVAIMQPSYGFRSPADGGTVDANRLAETADQAKAYGLGVEIEARGSAANAYEAAMFQQYLGEGARLGYRDAATAYFLGWNRAPVMRADAYTALADYINASTVRSGDTTPTWTWTGTTTRSATTTFASRDDLTAVRAEFTPSGSTWRGTVTAYVLVDGAWKPGGTTYAGTPAAAGARQTVLVPLAAQSPATGIGVTFTPSPGMAAAPVSRMVLEAVWPTGTASLTTGAPYTVSTGAAPLGQYSDTANTLNALGRGLLTDGQWSSTGWWNAKPVGWYGDNGPARVMFDLGSVRSVDKVVLYTHDSPDAAVNWPYNPAMVLSTTCPVLATALRGTVENCGATTTLTGSAPAVTSYNGPIGRQLDGTITFAAGTTTTSTVNARYATLVVQPTGWFLADEVRFFSGGVDVTSSVSYRILTPTNPSSVDTSNYGDNGVRLTDGNVAPMMSSPAVTGWKASAAQTVTVDLARTTSVRSATSWFVDAASWGVVKPTSVTVATSTDGVAWSTLGTATASSRTWYAPLATPSPAPPGRPATSRSRWPPTPPTRTAGTWPPRSKPAPDNPPTGARAPNPGAGSPVCHRTTSQPRSAPWARPCRYANRGSATHADWGGEPARPLARLTDLANEASVVAAAAPPGLRGRAMALRLTGNRLGQVAIPFTVGLPAPGLGAGGVLLATAASLGLTSAIARRLPVESQPPQGTDREP